MDKKNVVIFVVAAAALALAFCYVVEAAGFASLGASTIISILSLAVAAATFFLTQLTPARITSYVGPDATLGHLPDGGTGITMPVTFTNHGVRTGAVLRAGVTLWRRDSPNDRFFMQWNAFVKQNFVTNSYENEEAAHALAVPGKSIVARSVSFVWLPSNPRQIDFRAGTYCISFHYWDEVGNPHGETHEVDLSDSMVGVLKVNAGAVLVTLDETIRKNIHMNESEFRKLIGSK
jgi:hypothetical protein